MEHDLEKLSQEMRDKVKQSMSGQDALAEFFIYTLKNFAYRYFESETTGEAEIKSDEDNGLFVEAFEPHLATALKTGSKETRTGLIEMAKSFTKKDAPSARYRLGVITTHTNNQGGGKFTLFAEVHWGFPNYESNDSRNRIESVQEFEDSLELRNTFAKLLDDICDVY